MKILGIDPGYGITGFGLIEAERGQFKLLNCGAWHSYSILDCIRCKAYGSIPHASRESLHCCRHGRAGVLRCVPLVFLKIQERTSAMKRKSVMLKAFSIVLGTGWIPSALAYSVRAWQGKSDKDL